MEKPLLTENDFEAAAAKLRCDVPAIKSVSEVESKGKSFYADGFPTILFERHKFHKYTAGRFDQSHPEISNSEAGGYGPAGQHQRDKFNLAFSLDPVAAMKSCSWGKFQIMGFNYELCGFDSVGEFVDAMKESEHAQLDAFVRFIVSTGLSDELRSHKWTALAEGYNGLNQKKNNYDKKLAAAYRKFTSSAAASATIHPAVNNPPVENDAVSAGQPAVNQNDPNQTANQPPPENSNDTPELLEGKPPTTGTVEVQQITPEKEEPKDLISRFKAWYLAVPAGATAYFSAAEAWAKDAPLTLILTLLGISGAIVLIYIAANLTIKNLRESREAKLTEQREARAHEIQLAVINSAAQPHLNQVIVKPSNIQNSDAPQTT